MKNQQQGVSGSLWQSHSIIVWLRREREKSISAPNTQVKNKVILAYSLHLASILIFLYSRVYTSWKLRPILGYVPINQNSDNAENQRFLALTTKKIR